MAFLGDCPWEAGHGATPRRRVPPAAACRWRWCRCRTSTGSAVVEYALAALRAGHTPEPRRAVQPRHQVRGVRATGIGGGLRGGGQRPLRAPAAAGSRTATPPAPARAWTRSRDQSYFLAYLRPDQLSRLCFPIGGSAQARGPRHGSASGSLAPCGAARTARASASSAS